MALQWCDVETPVGKVRAIASERGLREVHVPARGRPPRDALPADLPDVRAAFRAFFDGRPEALAALPRDLAYGTPFQRKVWAALETIPYGETRSYAWLAAAVGSPRAFRAVGQANHRNPLGIVVPCHRVVAADGGLGGYAGGLAVKERLLAHEQRVRARRTAPA